MSTAVTLWIPGLLDPLRVKEINSLGEGLDDISLSGLQTILAKSDQFAAKKQAVVEQANYLFHQPKLSATAAIMASVDIAEYDASAFWLRVDPVQMIADRDSLVLIPGSDLGITEAESRALIETFNAHFEQDKVALEYADMTRWYLRIKQPIDIQTHSIEKVAFQPVNDFYPQGHAAQYWRSLLNEAQMLFYTHPVNEARRALGQPEINSVWVWGEGVLTDNSVVKRPNAVIWSDSIYLSGLAKLSEAKHFSEPGNYQAWLDTQEAHSLQSASTDSEQSHHLIKLDSVTNSLEQLSPEAWLELLSRLDERWFKPLLKAVVDKKIDSLFLDIGNGHRYHLTPAHLKRFWRFKRSLAKGV